MKIGSYIHEGMTSYGVRTSDGGIVDLRRRLEDRYPDLPTLLKAFALGEAEAVSDRIAIMAHGKIKCCGYNCNCNYN